MLHDLELVLLDASDADQLGLEDKNAVGRDRTHASAAVGPLGLDGQRALLSRAHVEQALVPTLDNLTLADVEAQRLASVVTGIKLLATILKSTTVVNLNLVTSLGLAATFNGLVDLNVERLVQGGNCGGEECQCTGQSSELHLCGFCRIVVKRSDEKLLDRKSVV